MLNASIGLYFCGFLEVTIRKSLVAEYSFFQYFYHFQNTSLVPSAVAEIVIGVVLKTKKLKS